MAVCGGVACSVVVGVGLSIGGKLMKSMYRDHRRKKRGGGRQRRKRREKNEKT